MITPLKRLADDWLLIDWHDVWCEKQIAPFDVPGVDMLEAHGILRAKYGARFPTRIHLTHAKLLGVDVALPRIFQGSGFTLRPHQIAGVEYIAQRRGTLLGDEMRVGKTATIMYSHDPEAGCLFVVGPLAARAVWHEWAARRFGWCLMPDCTICARVAERGAPAQPSFIALDGRAFDMTLFQNYQPRVVFCHYAILPTWRALFDQIQIGTLAADEVHLPQSGMQNRKSITSESLRFLNTVARRAVFASGSPLWNKPKGLWPILDMLTPGAFGDFWTYARRYCGAKPTAYGWQATGSSHEGELQTRLCDVMLRRRWIDIRDSLPPINRSVEIVPLSEDKQDAIAATAARIRSLGIAAQTVVGDLARLRKLYAKEKIAAAITKAREAIADGHSVIVWAWHQEIANTIAYQLECPVIHGGVPPSDREAIIEALRSAAGTRPVCLVATMATLATAVSLSFADVEIFAELDWNPDSIAQAEMRPFDGTRPIAAIFLTADCDVEQKLIDALLEKLAIKDKLGVAPGVGSVAEVLRATLGVSNQRTLDALADAVMAEAA